MAIQCVDLGECKVRYKTIYISQGFLGDPITYTERYELMKQSSLRVTQQIFIENLPCGY